jgi:hypothetical protein
MISGAFNCEGFGCETTHPIFLGDQEFPRALQNIYATSRHNGSEPGEARIPPHEHIPTHMPRHMTQASVFAFTALKCCVSFLILPLSSASMRENQSAQTIVSHIPPNKSMDEQLTKRLLLHPRQRILQHRTHIVHEVILRTSPLAHNIPQHLRLHEILIRDF